jgi:hypothetical protein
MYRTHPASPRRRRSSGKPRSQLHLLRIFIYIYLYANSYYTNTRQNLTRFEDIIKSSLEYYSIPRINFIVGILVRWQSIDDTLPLGSISRNVHPQKVQLHAPHSRADIGSMVTIFLCSFGLPYPPPMGFGDDGMGLLPAPQHPPTGISWVHSTFAYVRLYACNCVIREAVSFQA